MSDRLQVVLDLSATIWLSKWSSDCLTENATSAIVRVGVYVGIGTAQSTCVE